MATDKQIVTKLFSLAGVRVNGPQPHDLQVRDERFFPRVLSKGSLGLGESYMDGWWDCESLDEMINAMLKAELIRRVKPVKFMGQVIKARLLNMQDPVRSKRVAEVHYDLGNDFYEKMLDRRMQYTCAYWKNATTLDIAQEHKLDLICRKLGIKEGDKVLELGCGWGGFAHFAATKYGCHVTGYNISKEQVAYARELNKGLPVRIVHKDYRDATGTFDKVVSVGLCEHVGPKNYRIYFETAYKRLRKRGMFLLHTIGGNHSVAHTDPWLDKYIFPGSVLPSITQLGAAAEHLFVVEDWHNIGPDYDHTLMAWWANFERHWPHLKNGQFDERFYRMWKYYLLMCAGSFRSRKNQLWQVVFSKRGVPGGYATVR